VDPALRQQESDASVLKGEDIAWIFWRPTVTETVRVSADFAAKLGAAIHVIGSLLWRPCSEERDPQ
jgi:hypothetical protein